MADFTKDVENAVKAMNNGGLILYPTDTIWGLGCDGSNEKAVDKIFKIKKRPSTKSMIILVDSIEKLSRYITDVPDIVHSLMQQINTPLTIIYPKAVNLARNVLAADGSVGIRVVKDAFCIELCKAFNKPLVSTSANISGYDYPLIYREIEQEIQEKVNYIVEHARNEIRHIKPSTIIRLKNNCEYEILRS